MISTLGLYVVGNKGMAVLRVLFEELSTGSVKYVVAGNDQGVSNDYFDEIKRFCAEYRISFFTRDLLTEAELPDVDLKYAIGWKWLINDISKLIVFHDSLLPKFRGFAPLVNSLIAREEKIGVTALIASHQYDSGPIISQRSVETSYPMTINRAIKMIVPLYEQLALSTFQNYARTGKLKGTKQDESLCTYSPWRDEIDYSIPWNESAAYIERFCNAVGHPYKGASAFWGVKKIRISEVRKAVDVSVTDRPRHIGKVISKNGLKPVIICGSGMIEILNASYEDSGESVLEDLPFRVRFTNSAILHQ